MEDASLNTPPEWPTEQVTAVIKQLPADPVPSLRYLRDILLYFVASTHIPAEYTEEAIDAYFVSGSALEVDLTALSKSGLNPGLKAILDTMILRQGEELVENLVRLYQLPLIDLPEESTADSIWYLISGLIWVLVHLSSDFKTLLVAHNDLDSFFDFLFNDHTKNGVKRMSSSVVIATFRDDQACTTRLQKRYANEDPWQGVMATHALMLAGFQVVELMNLGALRCLADAGPSLKDASESQINAYVWVAKPLFRWLAHRNTESADPKFPEKLKDLQAAVQEKCLCSTNILSIIQGWMGQKEIAPSATLSTVVSDIMLQEGVTKAAVIKEIVQRLDVEDPDADALRGFTVSFFTFFGQESIPTAYKRLLAEQQEILDFLLKTLDNPDQHSLPPCAIEHYAAHSLANIIGSGACPEAVAQKLSEPKEHFRAVLGTLFSISEYDPFASIRTEEEDLMGGRLLVATMIDNFKDAANFVFGEMLKQMFSPVDNPHPKFGAGVLLGHLARYDVVQGLLQDGVVPFCFRLIQNTPVAEEAWTNGIALLASLARYAPGSVNIFADEGARKNIMDALLQPPFDPTVAASAQSSVSRLLASVACNSPPELIKRYREEGVIDALISIVLDCNATTTVKSDAIIALKEYAAVSDEVRGDIVRHNALLWLLTEFMFNIDSRPNDTGERLGNSSLRPALEAASLLSLLQASEVEYVTLAVNEIFSAATTVEARASLIIPLRKAFGVLSRTQALHVAIIMGGAVPLVFSVISDPIFMEEGSAALRRSASKILREELVARASETGIYDDLLSTPPGIVRVLLDWVHSDDQTLKSVGISGMVDVLEWTCSKDEDDGKTLRSMIRSEVLNLEHGICRDLAEELTRLAQLPSEAPLEEYDAFEEKLHRRRKSLQLLDALTGDESSFQEAKGVLIEVGMMKPLIQLLGLKETRPLAKTVVRRLKNDTLPPDLDDTNPSFDIPWFNWLCESLQRPSISLQEKAMCVSDLAVLMSLPKTQKALGEKSNFMRYLTDALFATSADGTPLDDDLEAMRSSARDAFDCIRHSEPLDALGESVVAQLKAHLTNPELACPKKTHQILSSVHYASEQSQGDIRKFFMDASLPELIVSAASNPEVTVQTVRLVVDVVEDFTAGPTVMGNAPKFVEAGLIPALINVVKTASGKALDGFRHLVPFNAFATLVCHNTVSVTDLEALHKAPEVVGLAVHEIKSDAKPASTPEELDSKEREWGTLTALAFARIAPLTYLDRVAANPRTFERVKEIFVNADVEEALKYVCDDDSPPGPYDFGTQNDMQNLAQDILDRLKLERLDDPVACRCWRCEKGRDGAATPRAH